MVYWKEDLRNVASVHLLLAGMKLLERLDQHREELRYELRRQREYLYQHTSVASSPYECFTGASLQTRSDDARARYISS